MSFSNHDFLDLDRKRHEVLRRIHKDYESKNLTALIRLCNYVMADAIDVGHGH